MNRNDFLRDIAYRLGREADLDVHVVETPTGNIDYVLISIESDNGITSFKLDFRAQFTIAHGRRVVSRPMT